MAAAWGGACAITSSTIPTHTLAFGQSQGLKIATTSSSAISRASYPREPTVPGPDPKGPGLLRLSWDAERRGATGPHSKVGRTRSGYCWSRVHSLLPYKRVWAPSCGTDRDPSLARSLGQLAVPSGSARSLSRVGLRPLSAE